MNGTAQRAKPRSPMGGTTEGHTMATMPDKTQEDPSEDAVDASGGYCIEINVDGSGAITVGVEPASEESAEESGSGEGAGDEEDTQPVANIREACRLVMEIFKSQGQLPDSDQDQADMSAGYGKD